jgi:GntR family transcriptional regulator
VLEPVQPPRPRYRQVADQLRDAIKRGDYPPGSALPSQPDLARRYSLNQTTINRAIAVLRQEGLVQVVQGRGAFVLHLPTVRRVRRIPHRVTGTSTFAEEIRRLGMEPKTDLVAETVTVVPDAVAVLLGVERDAQVLVRERRMFADARPVQLATSYIPLDIAGSPDIADPDTHPADLYRRLARHGQQVRRYAEEIEVRQPSLSEAAFLELAEARPVIQVTRVAFNDDDRAIDVAINVLDAYQWRLVYEWDHHQEAEDSNGG